MTTRSGPGSGSGFSSEHLPYHEQRRKYFSDYESQ
jgi:hypothetical protein